jgi:hypothetical protein
MVRRLSTKAHDRLVKLATADLDLFKLVIVDVISLYEKGRMRILVVGPAFRVHFWDPTDSEIIEQKNAIDGKALFDILDSILWMFHIVCSNEVPEVLKRLGGDATARDALSKKVAIVEEALAEHPTIRTGFYAYTLSTTGFFEDVSWSAELKAFHSKNEFIPEPHAPYPIGRVTLTTGRLVGSDIEPEAFGFDITANDLGSLIESLQRLKEALLNLEQKKLIGA